MSLILPSASAVELAMECAASAGLPRLSESTEATESGTALHEYLRSVVLGMSPDQAESLVPEEFRDDAHAIDVSKIRPLAYVRSEVAIAYSPVSRQGRVLGENIGRNYREYGWKSDSEYPGTPDLFGWDRDGLFHVFDFKTGSARTVPAARDNWQLKALCAGLAAVFGEDTVRAGIIRTRDTVRYDEWTFGAFELEFIREEMKRLFFRLKEQADSGVVSPRPGEHCRYCPSFRFCPAKTALAVQTVTMPELTAETFSELIAKDPATAYERFREANQVMFRLSEEFKRYASEHPIELSDGRVYGPVKTHEKVIDANVAAKVLKDQFGVDVAKRAMTFETSKAAIERAIGPECERGTKAARMRQVMSAVAADGGIKIKETVKFQARFPEPSERQSTDEGSAEGTDVVSRQLPSSLDSVRGEGSVSQPDQPQLERGFD